MGVANQAGLTKRRSKWTTILAINEEPFDLYLYPACLLSDPWHWGCQVACLPSAGDRL